MMGSSVNGLTGDYSRGAAGFMIRNGQIAEPVAEFTIAGNLKDMFLNVTPASDLEFKRGTDAPTLRLEAKLTCWRLKMIFADGGPPRPAIRQLCPGGGGQGPLLLRLATSGRVKSRLRNSDF